MSNHIADTSEFTEYYEKHKKAIFNYIFYRVGFDRALAEDLTSEIFLKAFQALSTYDTSRPFKTWVFTIAHNHLVNYFAGKKITLPLDEAQKIIKETQFSEMVDQRDMITKLLDLVSKLPAYQQELIIMRYVNDLSNTEIAKITGKEEGAIRTALSRAIATLRDLYNNQLHGH